MVNEVVFDERESQYQMWQESKNDYTTYMEEKITTGKIDGRHPITGLAEAFSGLGIAEGHNSRNRENQAPQRPLGGVDG